MNKNQCIDHMPTDDDIALQTSQDVKSCEDKGNILIVDDTLPNLKFLTDLLSESGYSVTGAPDGPTALMIARNALPDLILLDVLMPGMDGYEVCRLLKTDDKTSHIPVIFLSALDELEKRMKGFEFGGVDFISKPCHPEEVIARIETHLKLSNLQKELEEKTRRMEAEIIRRTRVEDELENHQRQLQEVIQERTEKLLWENNINKAVAMISADLLSADYDIQKIASLILSRAADLTGSKDAFALQIDNKTKDALVYPITDKENACGLLNKQTVFSINPDGAYNALWGHSLNTGAPFYTNNPKNHQSSKGLPEGHIPLERFLSLPVMLEGKIVGQLSLANAEKDYTEADIEAVRRIGNLFALAISRFNNEKEKDNLQKQLYRVQKLEALGTLSGGIAHDFNNILFPILGYAEMLREELPEHGGLKTKVDHILTGINRAKELTQQILTFCRQTEVKRIPLKIHLVVKEALKLIRSTLPTTISIHGNIRDSGRVSADPTQIHQIVMNLITNAFHAMEKGGTLSVSLQTEHLTPEFIHDPDVCSGDYVCLTIADTGIGMDKKVLERIFDPYFTTKEQGKGTGLGLAVVHGIVKSYKGMIRVNSESGKGSEFIVYLPQVPAKEAPDEKTGRQEIIPGGNEHILVVDDELPIADMLKQMLTGLGYQVTMRTGSVEAMEAFKAHPDRFHLVITDLTMPNMTGVELAEKILTVRANIPVIMCSGFSDELHAYAGRIPGIREYIMKPILKTELAKAIRRVIGNGSAAQTSSDNHQRIWKCDL